MPLPRSPAGSPGRGVSLATCAWRVPSRIDAGRRRAGETAEPETADELRPDGSVRARSELPATVATTVGAAVRRAGSRPELPAAAAAARLPDVGPRLSDLGRRLPDVRWRRSPAPR